jgi:hypothetical protein
MQTRQLIGFLLGTGPRPLAVYGGDVLTIGRDPQNIINLPDVLASRRHALIDCAPVSGDVFVMDLSSSNGTFLNEKKLTPHEKVKLHANDCVRIGGKLLSFVTNQPAAEPRAFGARVATQETVRDGQMMFKSGRMVELDGNGNKRDVNQTQKVPVLARQKGGDAGTSGGRRGVEPALSGNLADQHLAQIIQFLHANTKTGELHVRGRNNLGTMAFDSGAIYYAECGDRRGPPAIYVCAREHIGTFRFNAAPTAPTRPKNVSDPMMQIIFECCKRIDETELAGN